MGFVTAGSNRVPAAVCWDMDGTLVDSEKIWSVSLAELVARLGGELDQPTRESLIGANLVRTLDVLFAAAGREPEPAAAEEAGEWLLNRTAELFRAGLPWRPGAAEALAAVRAGGVPTALVTSTERELTEIALDTIGREFFDVTVCGDEVDGLTKPRPEPYLRAARLLGVPAGDCVVVEDSPTGVRAALAAGAAVLGVPCDAALAPAPGLVLRDSLVGVDLDVLAGVLAGRDSAAAAHTG
jgi:HAD superfamily hydrolase (TIGR01509 family)